MGRKKNEGKRRNPANPAKGAPVPLREIDRLKLLAQQGRYEEALLGVAKARVTPEELPELLRVQANLYRALSRHGEAISTLERLITLAGEQVEDLFAGALSLESLGRCEDAAMAFARVTRLDPSHAQAHLRLALLLVRLGHGDAAGKSFRNAITLKPAESYFWRKYGLYLQGESRLVEAQEALENAVRLAPKDFEAYLSLGAFHQVCGSIEKALCCYQTGIEERPEAAELHANLGSLFFSTANYREALCALDKAITIAPESPVALNTRAAVNFALHRFDEALADYRRAYAADPFYWGAFSNILLFSHYRDPERPQEVAEEHRRYGHALAAKVPVTPGLSPAPEEPGRRLRIGYLSPDFRLHSVAFFIESILASHDRGAVEVFCYSQVERPDETTARIERLADHFINLVPLEDAQACQRIRQDRIDILVDLAGHTSNNRLSVFAMRAAPVQVTWLGYPDTTGVTTMDYRLTDDVADPFPEAEGLNTERLLRLPDGFLCYTPGQNAPAVGPLPCDGNGVVTFGSFNNFNKVTSTCFRLWAAVLKAVPGSRFLIKARNLAAPDVFDCLQQHLDEAGLSRDRFEVMLHSPSIGDHLTLYNRMDIALDTFPYHGTTTTFESLLMGVPVITLQGRSHCSRVGGSILHHLGLDHYAVATEEEFVAVAQGLSHDRNELRRLRSTLRARMHASPLMDSAGFTRSLERVYREIWAEWTAGRYPVSPAPRPA